MINQETHMRDEGTVDLELLDLGDAMEETKQWGDYRIVPDALYGWGPWLVSDDV